MLCSWLVWFCAVQFSIMYLIVLGYAAFWIGVCKDSIQPFLINLEGLSGVHTAAWPDGLCPYREGRTQKDGCQEAVQVSEHYSSMTDGAVSDLSMDILLEAGLMWATFE